MRIESKIINLFAILILILSNCSCQKQVKKDLIVNKNIESKVMQNIIDTTTQSLRYCSYRQQTNSKLIHTQNDSIIFDNTDSTKFLNFTSNWNYKNDTLIIQGAFGNSRSSQYGFQIEYLNPNEYEVHLYTRGYLEPNYSANKHGELDFFLTVPTKESNVTLSQIPKQDAANAFIYGYIDLESEDFYESNKFLNSKEIIESRHKVSSKMSIYFKAKKC